MGFWQDFTGQTAKKEAKNAYNDSNSLVGTGYADAKGAIHSGYSDAQNSLAGGRADLTAGYDAASGMNNAAIGNYSKLLSNGGYDRAASMYGDALGAHGLGAQQAFGANYAASDPFRAANEDRANNTLMRGYAARGMMDSGEARLASARASEQRGSQDYGSYLDRLMGLSSQGAQIHQNQAGMQQSAGQMRYGYGQDLAGNNAGRGNLYVGQGNTLAGMATDNANTLAGNRINYGNARTQAANSGVNNLMNLAGTAASFAMSDRRLKRDVSRVGTTQGGLPVYRFRYRGADDDGREHIGVMAQEAREAFPHAVASRADGMLMVNYAEIS